MSGLWKITFVTLIGGVLAMSIGAHAVQTPSVPSKATEKPAASKATNSVAATRKAPEVKPPAAGEPTLKDAPLALELQTNDCVAFVGGTSVVGEAKLAFLETLLIRRFPGRNLKFRNLGWEGDTVFEQERPLNFPGLLQSLKQQHASVIFANFGLMESLRGGEGLADFVRAYNALLDGLGEVTPRIVLLAPARYETRQPGRPESAAKAKNLERYVRAIRELAQRRKLLFVDLFQLQNRDPASTDQEPLTSDGLHPSAYGYWRAAHEIVKSLGLTEPEWTVEIDARTRNSRAKGTELSRVQISTSTVQFRALDEALPSPVFRRSDGSSSVWKARTLKITGLLPGRYVFKIDGVPMSIQSQVFWERGRVMAHGPEFDQAETMRELIVRKNADFFNYWRPQNWAFLNGDLINQPSSHRHDGFGTRWFPSEIELFVPLIADKEKAINKLAKPEFHEYELRRVE